MRIMPKEGRLPDLHYTAVMPLLEMKTVDQRYLLAVV